jgi:hypothetical protein
MLVGTGTPAFAAGDYGMGAVTDNGTGNYTLALDTAFANANYWISGWARNNDANPLGICSAASAGTKTESSFQVNTRDTGGTAFDSPEIGINFWGAYA